MTDPKVQLETVRRMRDGAVASAADAVAVEEPLEIRVLGKAVAVVMRTPGDDEALAAGFVVTEGIAPREDVSAVAPCVGADGAPAANVVNVALIEGASIDVERLRRNLYASSSCGVCGKATLDAIDVAAGPVRSDLRVVPALLLRLADRARAAQSTFDATGGLHAACLFDARGNLIEIREDVGRHNAVDKVIGARLRDERTAFDQMILFVTGRAGFEIVQKARVAGIPIVAAVGAPSSLAIDCARRGEMTLIGFLREGGFNIYCGERVGEA